MPIPCIAQAVSEDVSIFYAVEPDPEVADLNTVPVVWYQVPVTGESLDATISSALSERILSSRGIAGSRKASGEVGGALNFEVQATEFLYDALLCALQADKDLYAKTGTTTWNALEPVKNGTTKHCLALLKRVRVGEGLYDWYIFRGCQISSLSIDIQPNSLITGTVNVMGLRPQAPIHNTSPAGGFHPFYVRNSDDTDWEILQVLKSDLSGWEDFQVRTVPPENWVYVTLPAAPLMSGGESLRDLQIITDGSTLDATLQNLSLTLDNQLRTQSTIGSTFPVGIGAGRLSVTYAGPVYYRNPSIFNAFLSDSAVQVSGQLLDENGNGIRFDSDAAKVFAGTVPQATSPDQDLLVSTEIEAFEAPAQGGAIRITRIAA
jgi:hypothetical protein